METVSADAARLGSYCEQVEPLHRHSQPRPLRTLNGLDQLLAAVRKRVKMAVERFFTLAAREIDVRNGAKRGPARQRLQSFGFRPRRTPED